jgi:predicted nucleic acid-binding protein
VKISDALTSLQRLYTETAPHNLRTPDALHVAAGIDARCDAFLTNDTGMKHVTEIAVLVLDELELDPSEAWYLICYEYIYA